MEAAISARLAVTAPAELIFPVVTVVGTSTPETIADTSTVVLAGTPKLPALRAGKLKVPTKLAVVTAGAFPAASGSTTVVTTMEPIARFVTRI